MNLKRKDWSSVITTDGDRINTLADEMEIIKEIEWLENQKTDMKK
jgi:hypothetical protein